MMRGMLWFDNDPKTTLVEKIETAMKFYFKKFGKFPELCLMSEKDSKGVDLAVVARAATLTVKASRLVQPHHLWIGYEETLPAAGEQ
jgi:hypothetical protein